MTTVCTSSSAEAKYKYYFHSDISQGYDIYLICERQIGHTSSNCASSDLGTRGYFVTVHSNFLNLSRPFIWISLYCN